MGIPQTIETTLTCVACKQTVLAEVDLLTPLGDPDAPMLFRVGDGLAPHDVGSYDWTLVRLRPREHPGRARVLADWICPVCRDFRWAIVELGPIDGRPSVVSVRAIAMTRAALDEADSIHPGLLNQLTREAGVSLPDQGQLTPAELATLKALLPDPDSEPSPRPRQPP